MWPLVTLKPQTLYINPKVNVIETLADQAVTFCNFERSVRIHLVSYLGNYGNGYFETLHILMCMTLRYSTFYGSFHTYHNTWMSVSVTITKDMRAAGGRICVKNVPGIK